jgi:hypothetical protein
MSVIINEFEIVAEPQPEQTPEAREEAPANAPPSPRDIQLALARAAERSLRVEAL